MSLSKRIILFSKIRILLSIVLGIGISVIIGCIIYDQQPVYGRDNSTDIKEVEAQIEHIVSEIKSEKGKWSDIAFLGNNLQDHNRFVAKAKVLIHIAPPKGDAFEVTLWYDKYLAKNNISIDQWENRFKWSRDSWQMYDLKEIWMKIIGAGVISTLLTIPLSWIAFFIVSWVWYFLLDRIRELSNAFRGHIEPERTLMEKPIKEISVKENAAIILEKPTKKQKIRRTRWLYLWENILLPINILIGTIWLIADFDIYSLLLLSLAFATIIGLKKRRLWGWRLNFVLLAAITLNFAFLQYSRDLQRYEIHANLSEILAKTGNISSDVATTQPPLFNTDEILIYLGIAVIFFFLPSTIYFARRQHLFNKEKSKAECCHPLESMECAIK